MALSEVVDRDLQAFAEGLVQPNMEWQGAYNVFARDSPSIKMANYSGVNAIPEWTNDTEDDIATTSVNDLYTRTLTATWYALQVRVTKKQRKDVPGVEDGAWRALGVSTANTYATIAAGLLNNAFGTTQAGDGVALCDNSHPTAGGGTRDNLLGSAFDRTAFMAAVNLASVWKSYHNHEFDFSNDGFYFLGSPTDSTLRESVHEVFSSIYSSSQMQSNAANGYNTTPIIWSRLTSSTRWFLVSKLHKPLNFWIREGAEENLAIDQDTLQSKLSVNFAVGVQASPDPTGIIGSSV